MPKFDWIRKVLVLGSGAIKIGEAAEFDYSGSQCLKALTEEGIETVLINPNIATIQTDPRLSGKVYLLPITPEFVEKVIKKEKPDGVILGFGGQTALNCGIELSKMGIFKKYNVKVLGTPIEAIEDTSDRERFRKVMLEAKVPPLRSKAANSIDRALKIAHEIGYPVIVRVAYTLGGKGSGVAKTDKELIKIVRLGLAQSRINQVLVEEYVGHWKELEYEVMRDYADNCLIVCNMENLDPMGVHTGDSIVVAPSQTLTNREYHLMRSSAINAIRHLGIVGECNIQWALNQNSEEYRVIEVNSRMSRSSALASKVTGYPLAYIATKLTIGYLLPELTNKVTEVTTACFEPALDYVVIKIPRWDLQKFKNVDRHIGPQMRSVGEVMAIGRCLEEALQKATRMLDNGKKGLVCNEHTKKESIEQIKDVLVNPTDERLYKLITALKLGISIEEIYRLSGVDPFFLYKLQNIIDMEKELQSLNLDHFDAIETIREAKRIGFSDEQIAICQQSDELSIRAFRKKANIIPVIKQIDTLAAEWPAKTNYLYLTYGGDEDDIELTNHNSKVIVLGSGVFRIGSSVEFDWCGVNTIWALKKNNVQEAIMVNYNPETVSTDYDVSDKLYFEELSLERILDIYDKENPSGIITSVGGQIPNNLAMKLENSGVNILGTSAEDIDLAEDRSKFSALLDQLNILQPSWSKLTSLSSAKRFAEKIGYPVLVRPSYVLSGSAMRVAYDENLLENFLNLAAKVSRDQPVVISKFIKKAKEVEVDGVSDGETCIIGAIVEHVENAGTHSGDATMSISVPPQTISLLIQNKIEEVTYKIVKALNIKGPFNIQYLVKDDTVYVIECNLRASRSIPFVSKTRGVNLIQLATLAMLNKKFSELPTCKLPPFSHVGVKVPQFSFMRLSGADPVLGVEMLSTGEVACLGENFADAFSKAIQSAQFRIPPKGGSVLITIGGEEPKRRVVPIAKDLEELGFKIYATKNTAKVLKNSGLHKVTVLHKVSETSIRPNILDYLQERKIDLVINVPMGWKKKNISDVLTDGYIIRRQAVEFNVPVITNLELAIALVKVLKQREHNGETIRSLNEYMNDLPWTIW